MASDDEGAHSAPTEFELTVRIRAPLLMRRSEIRAAAQALMEHLAEGLLWEAELRALVAMRSAEDPHGQEGPKDLTT